MAKQVSNFAILGGVVAAAAIVVGGFTWAFFTHTETVDPGHVGVIIDKPYFFGHSGIRPEPLKDGRIMLWATSSMVPVRMTTQSISIRVDDYSSADNILLDFETSVQFRVTDATRLLNEFGPAWFNDVVKPQYLAIVRDAVKKRTMSDMMSNVETSQAVDKEITNALTRLVEESKLPVTLVGVSLGRAKPNEAVLSQMDETAAQQQRQKTLAAATEAELGRKKEQIAKAEADNAYRNAMGLSPEMFIALEQIKRYAAACEKSGNICVIGSSSNPVIVTPNK